MRTPADGIPPIIAVDRGAAIPLHQQISTGFRSAILRRTLLPGQRVPSSRTLATELSISRIPVLGAYAELIAEGYFEGRGGSGTFISRSLPEPPKPRQRPFPRSGGALSGPRPLAQRAGLVPAREIHPWMRGWGAFGLHQPAIEGFPFKAWSSLAARHSRNPRATLLHRLDSLGSERLRQAVCAYLRTARSVRCEPQQIMIVSGSQQALDICARALCDPGTPVWVEEPGYWLARSAFLSAGARLVPVPVDGEGLDVAAGIEACRNARVAHVTPSHQFPLGATLSPARRLRLLEWAQRSGAWIVEDDYDGEFRYESAPVASLQGLDQNSRVIYIGTLSKVLFPSLRLGYMVIPADILEAFTAIRCAMDIAPTYLSQEVLADFLCEGHFGRHIRRMRSLYRERRTQLVAALAEHFGAGLEIHGADAGLHLTATWTRGEPDREVATRAARDGMWLWPLSPSYVGDAPRPGLILGYGSTAAAAIPQAVRQLRNLFPPAAKGRAR
ncbi:MAG TPA: PLP-dependent aminotransferase family protein [Terriglobales bacterium]|nr:PLP-dependent aminotransferase family protein [Terriglobales bacterium]